LVLWLDKDPESGVRQFLRLSLAFCAFITLGAGCATNAKTVETERTLYRPGEPVEVERQTTVKTTETEDGSGGVLSGTVNVVGETLALPFRAVGGLIRVIF
jgi:hypothetical protein